MYTNICKPLFDYAVALLLLLVLLPFLVVIGFFLTLHFKRFPLFFQERIGREEKTFTIWKFRTMSDEKKISKNPHSDEIRMTRFGEFLRRTGIDEFPQLINILKGEMSFTGPRPLLPEYLPLYSLEVRKRHSVKPGITGLAQVNGGNSLEWEKRFDYDLKYINSTSFYWDLIILLKTITLYSTRNRSNNIGVYNPQKKS